MSGLNEIIFLKIELFLFCKLCIMYFQLIIYVNGTIVVMKLKLYFTSMLKIRLVGNEVENEVVVDMHIILPF